MPIDLTVLPIQSTQAPPKLSAKIKEGAEVLSVLMSMSRYSTALERWYRRGCLAAAIPFVHESVKWVETESRNSSPEALLDLAYRVALRTAQPAACHLHHSIREFAMGFTGNGLCWEVVGLILSIGGLSAIIVSEIPEIDESDDQVDWMGLSKRLLQAADKCMQFCGDYGHPNDLGVNLILLSLILHSQVYGDAGKTIFRCGCSL